MPKTPDSGGIPLPPSWPPFNRDMWDDRAHCLLESLSRMGHEDEDYASVPAAINMSKGSLARAAKGRQESSIGIAKRLGGDKDGATKERHGDEEEEEVDVETRLRVKPTRVLKTYEQRRKFIAKAMDMHRRTIGGGRSGRRGRAECVSFFRRVLEILDEQYEEALGAEGVGDDIDDEGSPRAIKGRYVKSEEYGEPSSSSEEDEEESSEEEEGGGEEEEEEEDDEEDEEEGADDDMEEVKDVTPEQKKKQRKGPGRPRKNESASSLAPPKKPKVPKPKPRVVLTEQDFFDQHNDLCEVCNQPGEVLCCATCNLVFHVDCARPKLKEEPPDDWNCAYCWAAGVMGGKKDGKERRKAAQACREMERMRKDIKERDRKRAGGEIIEVESGFEGSEDDGDKNLAVVDTSGGASGDGVRVSVEEAALSGCRKCVKELATGMKTRKTHDDFCPRKWRSVGKPVYASPTAGVSSPTAVATAKREEVSATDEENVDDEGVEAEVKEEEEDLDDEDEEEERDNDVEEEEEEQTGLRDGGMVPLEVSAAAGCIKCLKELKTGEKTRKVHADICPRKYRGAYMLRTPADMPSMCSHTPGPAMEVDTEAKDDTNATKSDVAEAPEDVMSNFFAASVFPVPDAEEPPLKRRKVGRPPSRKSSDRVPGRPPAAEHPTSPMDGPAPLKEGAAAGCFKCKKELATGVKTRKTHSDDCPRKWRAAGVPPEGTPSPASAAATKARQEQQQLEQQKQAASGCKVPGGGGLQQEKGATTEDAMSPPRKLPGRPGRPPKLSYMSIPAQAVNTVTSATAMPPLKLPGRPGRPRKSSIESADTDSTAATIPPLKLPGRPGRPRKSSIESAPAETVNNPQAEVADTDSFATTLSPLKLPGRPGRPRKLPIESSPAETVNAPQAEVANTDSSAAAEPPLKSPGRPGKPPKVPGTSSPAEAVDALQAELADTDSSAAAEPPLKSPGRPDRPAETVHTDPLTGIVSDSFKRRGKRTRLEMTNSSAISTNTSTSITAAVDADAAAAAAAEQEEELVAVAAIGDLAKATAKEHEKNHPSDGSLKSKVYAKGADEYAMTLRGGGGAGEVTSKFDLREDVMTVDVPSSSAVLSSASTTVRDKNTGITCVVVKSIENKAQMMWPPVKIEAEVLVPKCKLESHEVYSLSTLGDGHEPVSVPDWRSDVDGTTGIICGEAAKKEGGPEHIRGGGRPKVENSASPAPGTPASTSAPRRGRPPTKQTKGGGTPKKNAKRAPIKKETNDNIAGVGVLNRKPGSLFDCSACLDIGKIKICCYCACRLCFNKFGKEQTILCDKCDQEYHTFCLGLDKIPDAEWECPACIDYAEKKVLLEQRKKEREAKRKVEEERRKEEEAKKEMAAAKRRAANIERKKKEDEKRRIADDQKKLFSEKRKSKELELRAQGLWQEKAPSPISMSVMHKRGPGRPPKAETMARMQAQFVQQHHHRAVANEHPVKRGRGRPRKDGSLPMPRKLPIKSEISMANLYFDNSDSNVERSRSGRKIQRTVFHDEMDGGGLMKRPRSDEHGGVAASASRQASMYLAKRSAAAAAKNGLTPASSKKEPRRKPGARECMQMSRKFSTTVIDQKYFDVLMDYSKRAKVDHLIRMRERMDEHSRFLEAQLAGLEALVKEKGEWTGKVPAARSKADSELAA